MKTDIQIRPLLETDIEDILQLTSRYAEFDLPNWRDRPSFEQAQKELHQADIYCLEEQSKHFVAIDTNQLFLGYIYIGISVDFFTKETQGFIKSLAVTKQAEGRGVGMKLLDFAETWSRKQGLKTIVLNVFANNSRAKTRYERAGYQAETIKYVKPL
ncbi:GNAT family N-acetyltransferase [Hazenella sp. IB182353]|uniref:GNAT family N-acetyltransferase n=1 Tax=Polycladospora coralii TaxID=2771432 RepID=UPI001745DBEC|nr:N-acetyltransferase [Polycladospora coralii]MBS7529996.1 GNAT family N-acetyltransferase [Polycladospora coralii]